MDRKVIRAIAICAFNRTYNIELNRCEYYGVTGLTAILRYVRDTYNIDVTDTWQTYKWFANKLYKQAKKNGCISSF
jgi:hypothetical protein